MAFELTDLADRISTRTVDLLSHQLLAPAITNMDWQPESLGVSKVRVWVFESQKDSLPNGDGGGTLTPALPSETDGFTNNSISWQDGSQQDGGEYVEIELDKAVTESWFTEVVNALQLPGNPEEQVARFLANRLAYAYDRNIIAGMIGEVATAKKRAINDVAGTFITTGGRVVGADNAAGKALFDDIRRFSLDATTGGFGLDAAGVRRDLFYVISPQEWLALSSYILSENWSDAMNEALVPGRGLFTPGAESLRMAVIDRVNVFVSTAITTATATAGLTLAGGTGNNDGKNVWRNLAGTTAAYTRATQAVISQVLDPSVNQIGDGSAAGNRKIGTLVRTSIIYGRKLVDDRQLFIREMRAEE